MSRLSSKVHFPTCFFSPFLLHCLSFFGTVQWALNGWGPNGSWNLHRTCKNKSLEKSGGCQKASDMVFVLALGPFIQVSALGCGWAGSVKTFFLPVALVNANRCSVLTWMLALGLPLSSLDFYLYGYLFMYVFIFHTLKNHPGMAWR